MKGLVVLMIMALVMISFVFAEEETTETKTTIVKTSTRIIEESNIPHLNENSSGTETAQDQENMGCSSCGKKPAGPDETRPYLENKDKAGLAMQERIEQMQTTEDVEHITHVGTVSRDIRPTIQTETLIREEEVSRTKQKPPPITTKSTDESEIHDE